MIGQQAPVKYLKVLLVEDNLMDVANVRHALRQIKVPTSLSAVVDGVEGLRTLEGHLAGFGGPVPDLILLDIYLPRMNGLEFLSRLKQNIELTDIPVWVVSSTQENEDIGHEKSLGAEYHFTKPLDQEQLIILQARLKELWENKPGK